jgi:hypothetical protein
MNRKAGTANEERALFSKCRADIDALTVPIHTSLRPRSHERGRSLGATPLRSFQRRLKTPKSGQTTSPSIPPVTRAIEEKAKENKSRGSEEAQAEDQPVAEEAPVVAEEPPVESASSVEEPSSGW